MTPSRPGIEPPGEFGDADREADLVDHAQEGSGAVHDGGRGLEPEHGGVEEDDCDHP